MNVLVIDDEWPSLFSGKGLRIVNISKRLSANHKMFFLHLNFHYGEKNKGAADLSFFENIKSIKEPFDNSFWGRIINLIAFLPGAFPKWRYKEQYASILKNFKLYIEENNIDIIHCYSFHGAQYLLEINIPKLLDLGDSYTLNIQRHLDKKSLSLKLLKDHIFALKVLRYEKLLINQFNKTLFVSSVDADLYKKYQHKISVIPNGVEVELEKEYSPVEDPIIVFTGHMNFGPNIDAATYFTNSIMPHIVSKVKDAKFYIVGADPIEEVNRLHDGKNVFVTGRVDSVKEWLDKAMIVVAPMVSGSGIKNKVLEAMAAVKPIVTTPMGVEALDIENGKDLVVENTEHDLANKVLDLINNEQIRKTISLHGFDTVKCLYSWQSVINQYEEFYREVVS